jgi:hypothetical protein
MLTFGFLLCTVCSLHAQTYSIDWYKIAGGGGTSTGAAYQVGGTIGQHDAGETMAGGQYSLTGGFWGFMAGVQTPGAPLLKIAYSGTSVVVSWPSPSTGLVLQQNSSVASQTGWLNFAGVVNDNGTTKTITNALPSGNLFFRLARP